LVESIGARHSRPDINAPILDSSSNLQVNTGDMNEIDQMDLMEEECYFSTGSPGSRSVPIYISSSPPSSDEWPVERPVTPPAFFMFE
jgi:hypothetical protein